MLLSAISGAVFADYYEVINDTLANPTLYGGVYANEKYILVGEGGSIYYSIIAKKRISLMKPQKEFNCAYFSDLVSYITLDDSGRVKLHTKTETII